MKFKPEPVKPSKFKKRLDLQGIDNLDDALNLLNLYNEWRTDQTCLSLEELGITPSLITAAIHYMLTKFHANKPIYKCAFCEHCENESRCMCTDGKCHYRRIKPE